MSRVVFGRLELEGSAWPLTVVRVGVDAKDAFAVATVQDQQPVQTLSAYGPDEALGDRVRLRRPDRVFTIHSPSLRKISSKGPVYLLSRSRIRKRTPWSERSSPTRSGECRREGKAPLQLREVPERSRNAFLRWRSPSTLPPSSAVQSLPALPLTALG
jgi:hypothetical protein